MTQAEETCDEQRCARKQDNRKRDLRPNQEFAETLLAHAAGRAASTFLKSIDNVGAGALHCGIETHHQTGKQGKRDGEREHRK